MTGPVDETTETPAEGTTATGLTPFDVTGPLPTGTTLLEASAGTGKTWTIGALVARYVADGVARLDEMLVITFGRAASQELRERVREHLRHVYGALSDPASGSDDPVVELLRQGDPEQVAERTRRLREALTGFDAATIATTHQFCQVVLRGLGVAGDTDSRARLVEDLSDLRDEVVADLYLAEVAGPSGGEPPLSHAEAAAVAARATEDPHATLVPTQPPPDPADAARVTFARRVREEMDRRKRQLGVLSFDDLLGQLADALADEDSPARRRMRQRWRVVLVDEFQDTDPVQWQVLDRAFTGHSTLVLIGDPKQAIYGFRGGDVDTYLEASRSAGTRHTLGTNHRSDAPLVHALGTVLRGAELGDEQIVVHDVGTRLTEGRLLTPRGDSAPPMRLRVVPRELVAEDDGRVLIGRVRELVARDAAHEIARLVDAGLTFAGRPVRAGDVAVLARTNDELEQVRSALAEVGLRSVMVGTDSIFGSAAATQWLTLLEALEATHRPPRVRAAGLTPFVGLDAVALEDGGDELADDLARRLRRWSELFARRGVAAVMAAAASSGLDARVLGTAGGARHLTDLRHLAELLHQRAVNEGDGLASLSTWLRERIADDTRTERSRRLDSDADAVHLSTIHGSKGLQYPIVVAPFLSNRYAGKAPDTLRFHDPVTRERCLDVGVRSDRGRREREEAHQAEELGESLRLVYVALTRAQSHLLTWWFPSGRNTASAPLHRLLFGRQPGEGPARDEQPVPGDQTAMAVLAGWRDLGGPSLERVEPRPRVLRGDEEAPAELSVRAFTREVDTQWQRTSYTALTQAADDIAPASLSLVDSEVEDPPRQDEELVGVDIDSVPGVDDGGPDEAGDGPADGGSRPDRASAGTDGAPAAPDTRPDVPSPMADLPVGATFGSLVHAVLEHADPEADDLAAEMRRLVDEHVVRWPVDGLDRSRLAEALVAVCDSPLGPLAAETTLRRVPMRDRLCEMDFELPLAGGDEAPTSPAQVVLGDLAPLLREHLPEGDPVRAWASSLDDPVLGDQPLRGYLTGSVDVAMRVDGRYLVVDYKTNWLGPVDEPLTARAYDRSALDAAMGHSSYPLQALLYAVVLHRYLRWRLAGYDPEQHLGGVLYLYVRGMCGPQTPVVDGHPCGVFSWRPPVALVEAVSGLLDGQGDRS